MRDGGGEKGTSRSKNKEIERNATIPIGFSRGVVGQELLPRKGHARKDRRAGMVKCTLNDIIMDRRNEKEIEDRKTDGERNVG